MGEGRPKIKVGIKEGVCYADIAFLHRLCHSVKHFFAENVKSFCYATFDFFIDIKSRIL